MMSKREVGDVSDSSRDVRVVGLGDVDVMYVAVTTPASSRSTISIYGSAMVERRGGVLEVGGGRWRGGIVWVCSVNIKTCRS